MNRKIDLACVIDDDPIYTFYVKRAFKHLDYCKNILFYSDGKAAYDNLKAIIDSDNSVPDLILLDINMPVWDGWQFLDEFVKIKPSKKITIYMVTSSVDPEDLERSKGYEEVSDFFVKPISKQDLMEMLERMD